MPNTAYNCDNVLKPYIGYSGGDIIFNRNVAWDDVSTTDEGGYLDYQYHDFESVVLHELGHFMGLGHIPETNSAMSSVVYNASQKRNLNNCDIKALQDLYPNTIPLQLPCSSFVQGTEGDTGSQNPGTSSGSGGTGNNCRIITNPNHFSPEVIRGVFEFFGQGNIRKHINMFSAQIVANQSQFDKIITSSEARYKPVQDALMNAVIANQNLMDRTFAKKENPIVTNINLDPICVFLEELLLVVDDTGFRTEIMRFKKGLTIMQNKELKRGLIEYDSQQNFDNISSYKCYSSGKTDIVDFHKLATRYLGNSQVYLRFDTQPNDHVAFTIYDINGHLVYQQAITNEHTFEIDLSNKPKGVYIIKASINGQFLDENYKMVIL